MASVSFVHYKHFPFQTFFDGLSALSENCCFFFFSLNQLVLIFKNWLFLLVSPAKQTSECFIKRLLLYFLLKHAVFTS